MEVWHMRHKPDSSNYERAWARELGGDRANDYHVSRSSDQEATPHSPSLKAEPNPVTAVVILLVLGALGVWGAIQLFSSDFGSSKGRDSKTRFSASDLQARRQAAQEFWRPVIVNLGVAGAALDYAARQAQAGDAVGAQEALAAAEKRADIASQASLDDPPDGWDNIGSNLYSASNTYKKAIQEMRDGIGSSNSEQMANALDDTQEANNELTSATHEARVWYVQNGGKASDIEEGRDAERAAMTLLGL
jgi:hypothetical protein